LDTDIIRIKKTPTQGAHSAFWGIAATLALIKWVNS
jgi:hypothetical protein